MTDFIGFTYNGKHSIRDFEVYRTSDGSRYNDNLVPNMNDKTADVPGSNGQYFFNTTYKNRQFSISIAFEHLTEDKYREMRSWLDGQTIHDLIFDEAPYKVYSAKVTGTPQLKTICFDEDGQRVYKGEGSIQFTCYYPYAHTPETINGKDGKTLEAYDNNNKEEWAGASKLTSEFTIGDNKGDVPTPFKLFFEEEVINGAIFVVGELKITILETCTKLKWDSQNGLVVGNVGGEIRPIAYTGKSYGTIPVDGLDPSVNISYQTTNENDQKVIYYGDGTKITYKDNGEPLIETKVELPYSLKYHYWYY